MSSIVARHSRRVARIARIASVVLLPVGTLRAQRVEITLDKRVASAAVTGRAFVFFAKNENREPRLQAGSYGGSVPFFGTDVDQWRPGTTVSIDAKTLGFPYESLASLPAGDYFVQAMLEPYTRFTRADGHVI